MRPILVCLLFVICLAILPAGEAGQAKRAVSPVVIELFHSESCSSCPQAEVYLQKILDQARKQKVPVYCLGFHVDYWNHLKHVDPYSDAEYTARQERYVKALRLRGKVTPSTIVNGHLHLSGAGYKGIMQLLGNELGQPPVAAAAIEEPVLTDGRLTATVAAKGRLDGSELCAAVTEGGLVTEVKAGENRGETLEHGFTVRAFARAEWSATADEEGIGRQELELAVPPEVDPARARLVVFFQDPASMRIITARAVGLGGGEDAATTADDPLEEAAGDAAGPDVPVLP